ncbi:MAG: ATP-binding cassette domain-containing protein [Eisenbergiella sp.]
MYISHKMEEIFQICDEITVLRDGEFIGHKSTSELDNEQLVQMMVGRELKDMYAKSDVKPGSVALEVKNLSSDAFENVSFSVRHGEVVGFAGLMGAGRSEVMETIFGLRKKSGGTVIKDGREIQIKSPKDAIENKIAFVTEDRKNRSVSEHADYF